MMKHTLVIRKGFTQGGVAYYAECSCDGIEYGNRADTAFGALGVWLEHVEASSASE